MGLGRRLVVFLAPWHVAHYSGIQKDSCIEAATDELLV